MTIALNDSYAPAATATASAAAAAAGNPFLGGGFRQSASMLASAHLMFYVDGTGSTGPFMPGVTAVVKDLVAELPKRIGNCSFGAHVGRDSDCDKDHDVRLGDDLSADELIKQLALINYHGGGDALETQVSSALLIGETTAWKTGTGSRLVLVMLTSDDSKNMADGSTGAQVGAKLGAMGVRVITVAPPDAKNVHDLAIHSGGESMPLSNNPNPDDLRRLRDRITKSVTQMAPVGKNGTVGVGTPTTGFGHNGTVALG